MRARDDSPARMEGVTLFQPSTVASAAAAALTTYTIWATASLAFHELNEAVPIRLGPHVIVLGSTHPVDWADELAVYQVIDKQPGSMLSVCPGGCTADAQAAAAAQIESPL